MNKQQLVDTARALVAGDKGLLAMDESNTTCNQRFAKLEIPQTEQARRAYRELIVTTPGLGESISGAILYDETIRQHKRDGTPFVKAIADAGIIPGIKVDTGAKDLAGHPGEKITEGLDGLRDRLAEYFSNGRAFRQVARCNRRGRWHPQPCCRSRPTRRRWLAMPRCARKPDWFPSSSPKCSWTARTRWSGAAK